MSMIIAPPSPPPSPASQGPPKNGGGSAPPGGDPFASVLDQQARTATAEGLAKQQDAGNANGASGRGEVPAGDTQQAGTDAVAPGAEGTDPAALAAALNSLLNGTTPAPTAPVAAAATTATPAELPAEPAATPLPAAAEEPALPLPAAPTATSPALAETPALDPAGPTAPQPVASERLPEPQLEAPRLNVPVVAEEAPPEESRSAATPAAATTDDAPVAGSATRGDASGADGDSDPAPRQPAAQSAVAAAAGRGENAAAAAAPAANAPTAPAGSSADAGAAAQPAAAAPAPAAPSGDGSPVGPHPLGSIHTATAADRAAAAALPARPVTLDHAVETVRLAMRAGAERGVTHARIALSPAELGGIEIHLRHTADGIVAKVIADTTGAAQLLQQSAGDLQRDLEQQGLNLLRLDIGASGQQAGEASGQQGFGEFADGPRGGLHGAGPDDELLTIATDAPAAPRSLRLPNGALVDVLA